jgi:hypothetical protein
MYDGTIKQNTTKAPPSLPNPIMGRLKKSVIAARRNVTKAQEARRRAHHPDERRREETPLQIETTEIELPEYRPPPEPSPKPPPTQGPHRSTLYRSRKKYLVGRVERLQRILEGAEGTSLHLPSPFSLPHDTGRHGKLRELRVRAEDLERQIRERIEREAAAQRMVNPEGWGWVLTT